MKFTKSLLLSSVLSISMANLAMAASEVQPDHHSEADHAETCAADDISELDELAADMDADLVEEDEFLIFNKGFDSAPRPSIDNSITFNTNIIFGKGPTGTRFTTSQKNKVARAARLLKAIVKSNVFKKKVQNYKGLNGASSFVDNGGLTRAQIYQRILDGSERLNRYGKNKTVDLEVQLYYEDSTVVGYTYPSVRWVRMNTKYFNKYTELSVARNMIHEWLHKLGFKHDFEATARRPYSVPYGVGSILRSSYKELKRAGALKNI